MAFDYASLADEVTVLLADFGRNVTVTKRDQDPLNAAQPWRAQETSGNVSVTLPAVLLDYKLSAIDGEHVKRGDKMAYISADATVQDLELFDTVLDGSDRWSIQKVERLQPGPVNMLYILQLRK